MIKYRLNYEILIKNTERLEDLLITYKGNDACLGALYKILEPLFKQVYKKQVERRIGNASIDAVLSCAGYQIVDSGCDHDYPDLRDLYSDFYWEIQGLGTHPDRKPGHFYINSVETENIRFGC